MRVRETQGERDEKARETPEAGGSQVRETPGGAGSRAWAVSGAAGAQVRIAADAVGVHVRGRSEAAGAQVREAPGAAGAQEREAQGAAGAQERMAAEAAGVHVCEGSDATGAQVRMAAETAGTQAWEAPEGAGVHVREGSEAAGAQACEAPGGAGAQVREMPEVAGARARAASDSVGAFDPVAYINTPRWQASRLGLERIRALLDRLGRPQDALRFVHVAGTNGKGSTCAYLAAVLQAAGYRTGLFTSPFILRFEERIRVNGSDISRDDLARATLLVREQAEALERETGDHPTEFELMCAVALVHFRAVGCDIVVMEVGLGGRLDSTNVIDAPEVCVIARIGLDHTALLGDTLAAVAGEKCGIIKSGVPVASWPQAPEALAVVREACAARGCELSLPNFESLQVEPLKLHQGKGSAPTSADDGASVPADSRLFVGTRASWDASAFAGDCASRDALSSGMALFESAEPLGDSLPSEGACSPGGIGLSENAWPSEDGRGVCRERGAHGAERTENVSRETFVCSMGDGGEVEGRRGDKGAGDSACFASSQLQSVSRETFVRHFSYESVDYMTALLGSYQPANAALAIEALRLLRERGWRISPEAVREGVAAARWPGRFEVVAARPLTIIDGGHNPQGAQALADSLADLLAALGRGASGSAASGEPDVPLAPRACGATAPLGAPDALGDCSARAACGATAPLGASAPLGSFVPAAAPVPGELASPPVPGACDAIVLAGAPAPMLPYDDEKGHRNVVLVMGVLADKDYTAMIEAVAPLADAFVCYTPDSPRALAAADLAAAVRATASALAAPAAALAPVAVAPTTAAVPAPAPDSATAATSAPAPTPAAAAVPAPAAPAPAPTPAAAAPAPDAFPATSAPAPDASPVTVAVPAPAAPAPVLASSPVIEAVPDAAAALRRGRSAAGADGIVVAFGTLYAIADLKRAL